MSDPQPARRPLPRVRVTAPRSRQDAASARPAPRTVEVVNEVDVVFVRSLIRSQLRLALTCAAVFGALLALLAVLIAVVPALGEWFLGGVPASWLLLAAGAYPLVLATAVIFVRAARRNEARYRSLAEDA